MVKCATCGTAWTSSGLPLCPVCGTRIEEPVALLKAPKEVPQPEPVSVLNYAAPDFYDHHGSNGSVVLETLPDSQPDTNEEPAPEATDESGILPVQAGAKVLPAPARPMNGPLILGFLAWVPALMLPWTLAFEDTRVLGILGFCMSGFFAPFAPIAWIVGSSAEKRRRAQGLRSERRVVIGRLLGQGATLMLVAELTAALVGIAALRLAGKFPDTFWSYF